VKWARSHRLLSNIVLYQPEIPQNCGNIIRTCSATGANLFLVRPLGFALTERQLKRAGLDYIKNVTITEVDTLEELLDDDFYLFSTKGTRLYTEVEYKPSTKLIFGPESRGLPEALLEKYPERVVTIPMLEGNRSLNLANTVAIGAYAAWQSLGFE